MIVRAVVLGFALTTVPHRAPQVAVQGIAGQWDVVYERRTATGSSAATTGTARMTLEQRGDSIVGRWEPTNLVQHQVGLPFILHGTLRAGKARVVGDPDHSMWDRVMDYLKETIHGIQPAVTAVNYDFSIRGDTLRGTLASVGPDGRVAEARAFTGVRARP